VQEPAAGQGKETPRVVAIRVEGNTRATDEQLIAALGIEVGAPFDPADPSSQAAISEGIHALGDAFHVRPAVDAREVEGGIELRLTVVELPYDLEPRFVGNAEVDDEELREWTRIEQGAELYLHQAPRIRERLLDAYRRHGYYFVEVREVIREGGVEDGKIVAPDVIFEIHEGPQVHVRDLVIMGNEDMPDRGMLLWKDGLREFADVQLAAPRFFGIFKDEFDEEALNGDLQAMRQVFRDRGWLDVVVALERLDFSAERDWVTIHVRIDQGPRYSVGSLDLEAVERYVPAGADPGDDPAERPDDLLFDREKLLKLCKLQPGSFFEARLQAGDERALRDYYGERGYVYHDTLPAVDRFEFLEPTLVFEEGSPVVHVKYRLAQGQQQFLREILISGNANTADRVIRGRITMEPGKVADLTKIARSRARIQSLGFFSDRRPDVEHIDPYFRFLKTEDPAWKDLEYVVEETNALSFTASGGVSSSTGLFGVFEFKKQNFDFTDLPSSWDSAFQEIADGRAFHGAGQTLTIRLAPGTQTSSYEIRWREPDIFRRYDDPIGLDLLARRRLRLFDSHDEEREEYGAGLRYQVGEDSYVRAGVYLGDVKLDDLDGGGEPTLGQPLPVPVLLKEQEGEWDLGWLDLGYEFSRLDDFYYPQNGNTFEASVLLYDDALGSDFSFLKSTLQFSHLGQFGEESLDSRPGYKVELNAGVGMPYGGTDDVPYSERFYLGGQSSIRGFDFRGVGPNENGFPMGGEGMLSGTLEYRRPLITSIQPGTFRELEVIRWGAFIDAGILDPDDFGFDLDEVRASTGVFIGLTLPLAFTLSYGLPILEGDDDQDERIQFNIGF
jgi:outer membrane protein insertion porin family